MENNVNQNKMEMDILIIPQKSVINLIFMILGLTVNLVEQPQMKQV
jgi:hypothetical protein